MSETCERHGFCASPKQFSLHPFLCYYGYNRIFVKLHIGPAVLQRGCSEDCSLLPPGNSNSLFYSVKVLVAEDLSLILYSRKWPPWSGGPTAPPKNIPCPPLNPPAILRKSGGTFQSGFVTASILLQQPPNKKAEAVSIWVLHALRQVSTMQQ